MGKPAKLTAPKLTVDRARDVRQASDVRDMWPKRKKRRGDNDDTLAAVRNGAMKPKVRIGAACRRGAAANDDAMAVFVKQIEEKLRACAHVIDNMPMGKRGYPSSGGSGWPDVVHDYWEASSQTLSSLPRIIPNDDQIDAAMTFMQQLSQLERRERNIVTWKAFGFSYRAIGEELKCSYMTVSRDYKKALLVFAMIVQKSA